VRQRLYKTESVNAGLRSSRGRLREAALSERALAVQWCSAFADEAIPNRPSDPEELRTAI
jgi:hypothetical protein